jgi:hypothetical protein
MIAGGMRMPRVPADGDRADGKLFVVACCQHLRQGNHRQRNHGRADYAARRGEDRAHYHYGDRKRAWAPF